MASLTFELITPHGITYAQDVYEVVLPTPYGHIGVLPHHLPLISLVVPGVISIRRHPGDSEQQREYVATSGGIIEINGLHSA